MKPNRVERLKERMMNAGKTIERSRSLSSSPQISRPDFRRSGSDIQPDFRRSGSDIQLRTPGMVRNHEFNGASSPISRVVNTPPPKEENNKLEDPLEVVTAALEKLEVEDKVKKAPKMLFQKVMNFRDLAESDHRVNKGLLFRSGLIHLASERDLQTLAGDFRIKTLIDLRSSDEIKQHSSTVLDSYFAPQSNGVIYSPHRSSRMRINCPLWKATMNIRILIEGKKYRNLASGVFNYCIGEKQQGIKTILGEMNEIKLPGMYQCFVRFAQREIKMAFDILSDPKNYPVLVHCSLGKDRTGVIMALVSETLGIDRNVICHEYSKSQYNLSSIRNEIKEAMSKYHFGDWLLDSPYEVMDGFLQFIDQSFGSTSNFLNSIGVNHHQQHTIRCILHGQ